MVICSILHKLRHKKQEARQWKSIDILRGIALLSILVNAFLINLIILMPLDGASVTMSNTWWKCTIKKMSAEETKQDCETKTFQRLAAKLKKAFPRLPICIMGDSLYAREKMFQICDANEWNYLIRFKDGSIPSVATEIQLLKERKLIFQTLYEEIMRSTIYHICLNYDSLFYYGFY